MITAERIQCPSVRKISWNPSELWSPASVENWEPPSAWKATFSVERRCIYITVQRQTSRKVYLPLPLPPPQKKKKIYARFMKHDTENQPLKRPDFSPLSNRPPSSNPFIYHLFTPQPTLVFTLSTLFSTRFPWHWQGKFLSQTRATVVVDHFLYSHDLNFWFRNDTVGRN